MDNKILAQILEELKYQNGIKNVRNDFRNFVSNEKIPSKCNAIAFLNQGNSSITINDSLILAPNSSLFSINQDLGVEDTTTYSIVFGVGTNNNLLVIRTYHERTC